MGRTNFKGVKRPVVITFRPCTAPAHAGICFLEQSLLRRHGNEAQVRSYYFRAQPNSTEVYCAKPGGTGKQCVFALETVKKKTEQ